jgi:hypothetical protein
MSLGLLHVWVLVKDHPSRSKPHPNEKKWGILPNFQGSALSYETILSSVAPKWFRNFHTEPFLVPENWGVFDVCYETLSKFRYRVANFDSFVDHLKVPYKLYEVIYSFLLILIVPHILYEIGYGFVIDTPIH